MSLKRLSPSANLLRTSRLFSLPPPSRRPAPDLGAITNFNSDTATTPYPIHAAIETTQSSLARGDWGLKRPLPLKSTTKTSTPVIHIDNLDSIDHITDFGSAADHALTLQKWQELDLPLTISETRTTVTKNDLTPQRSAFNSTYDNTDISSLNASSDFSRKRWKYKGPWLAGKTEGDFEHYVQKKVKNRKFDFRRYVAVRYVQIKAAARQREAIEQGKDLDGMSQDHGSVSEEEIDIYLRRLRNNEDELHRFVEEYLDLPREEDQSGGRGKQYSKKGPPTTHPSAGFSYLRTDSYIYNHPELGPQESRAPIQGRVVLPQKTGDRNNPCALIGIAGVVGKDKMTFFKEKSDEIATGVGYYDPDIPGGGKLWVEPRKASIDSHGHVELILDRAEINALNVALGTYSEEPKLPQAAVAAAQDRAMPNMASTRRKSSRRSTGYGLEDLESSKGSGRATPFLGPDDEAPKDALNQLLDNGHLGQRR